MGIKDKARVVLAALSLTLTCAPLSAQNDTEQKDSLVRLLKAQSLELQEKAGQALRKTVDATFLHNGTYLICDTALWNVDAKVINCWGNVKLMQEETELTSDKLDYFVDEDLAQFRGALVQLRNKKDNILRTRNLDYNTRDSVAIFRGGAAMRDQDGQIIESDSGTYESARQFFTFNGNVNMFTDSIFVKTDNLTYDSERSIANFVSYIDFWKDDNMLSAGRGWYDRGSETFFFQKDVHGLTENQESWCDSLYFYRTPQNVKMLGNAQVQDTTRGVAGLANYIFYEDSLSRVTMRDNAAVAVKTNQNEKIDTLYIGADNLTYWTKKMCDIPESEVKTSKSRLAEILSDPVREYRRKAAEEAARAAEEAARDNPDLQGPPVPARKAKDQVPSPASAPAGPSAPADTLQPVDSVMTLDSVKVELPPPDTTRMGFLIANRNVKMFREYMPVRCDSLQYCDLDSIARLFKSPIVWNEGNRQYTSDSLAVLLRDGGVDRASLMSNAFIITQEDSICYDQIKGTDVVAYFDKESNLSRFDALGGATALFYLKEEETFATVNKVESKMLCATFKEGDIDHVYYFDQPQNDAFPVAQMNEDDKRMKGFNWTPEGRPASKDDITSLTMKPSERRAYESRPKALFKQTEIFFPGYIVEVYKGIAEARANRNRPKPADTTSVLTDSLAVAADSLAAPLDSLGGISPVDSAAVSSQMPDSLAVVPAAADTLSQAVPAGAPSKADLRKEKQDQREQFRALRIARRDAKWRELDEKDAAKAAAKAEKALKKKRAATLKAVLRQRKQDGKDEIKLSKYIEQFEKRKARKGITETKTEDETEESQQQPERTD